MKTKITYGILVFAAILMAGCAQPPRKNQALDYIEELKTYFPHTVDEKLVFVNEELGRTWETNAIADDKGNCPGYDLEINDSFGTKSYGDWVIAVGVLMGKEGQKYSVDEKYSSYGVLIYGNPINFNEKWNITIRLNENENYSGSKWTEDYPIEDFYLIRTDTIVLPIGNAIGDPIKPDKELLAGSYARIVRNKGLTDFCVDGKTVWRRVK